MRKTPQRELFESLHEGPTPKLTRQVALRVTADQYDQLLAVANGQGQKIAAFLRAAVRSHLATL